MARPKRPAPQCLNTHLLPPQLRLLIRVMGEGPALELAAQRGGTQLTVPVRVRRDHWLYDVVGHTAFAALVAECAGITLELPKYDKVLQQHRHQRVHALAREGWTQGEIAVETNYTRRHVITICQAEAEAAAAGQMDIFRDWLDKEDAEPETAAEATPTAHNPFGLAKR